MINWCDFTADNLVSCPVLLLVFLTPVQPVQANNFLEIDRHQAVYRVVVGIVRELAAQHCLVSLLGPLPDQATSLHCLLQGMESQARIMIDKIGELPGLLTAPPGGPRFRSRLYRGLGQHGNTSYTTVFCVSPRLGVTQCTGRTNWIMVV